MTFYLLLFQDLGSERNYTLFFPVVFVPVILIAYAGHRLRRSRTLLRVKKEYESSLNQLKLNPNNSDLKHRTFVLGTNYVNLSKRVFGKSRFDETVLKNDMDVAATASRDQ